MEIAKDFSLKHLNTFGIDVKAARYGEVRQVEELQALLQSPTRTEQRLILGGGSNILFTADFPGLVIKMGIEEIEKVKEDDDHVWIKAGAGTNWHELVLYCIEQDWGGIENLSLIPGTVGAAPMQNIGAYGVEIKDVFESLEAVEIATGNVVSFDNTSCQFGYRESIFKKEAKGQYVIASVTLKLSKHHTFNTSYGAIQDTLTEMGIEKLSIKAVSDAVIKIRQSKLPDPAEIGNAGSFFKNPTIEAIDYEGLKAEFPTIPGYEQPGAKVKVPAGWLIEQCGWKGKTFGSIGVHKNQALVLVNYGGGKGTDIKQLALDVQASVRDKFGIELMAEVNIV
ncbi:MAG: UDP-N-acetylmuramate dehydrogenase [Bacteroidota bacterium]